MSNRLSVHISSGRRDGFGDWLSSLTQNGNSPPIIYSVNENIDATLRDYSPLTSWIYRYQSDVFNRLPSDFWQGDPRSNARNWLTVLKQNNRTLLEQWSLNPADYFDPLNEPVPGTVAQAQWLNEWMLEALEIAHQHNFSLALFSFATGSPEYNLWQYLVPALRLGRQYHAILSIHGYNDGGLNERNSQGDPSEGALHNAFRHRQIYPLLPTDARLGIVYSEASGGNGYNTGMAGQAWVNDLIGYAQQLGDDPNDAYVESICAYQLGGNESNCYTALQVYADSVNAQDWSDHPDPPDPIPPAQTSTSGDFAGRSSLVDNSGAVWSFKFDDAAAPGYLVLKNGVPFAGGRGTGFVFYNGKVYITNRETDPKWFEITTTGYTAIAGDPRLTSAPIPPNPQPDPFWVAWPIKSSEATRITDKFNAPRSYANGKHEGLDCDGYDNSTGQNATVVAAQDGIVEYVVNRSGTGYGLHVVIRHPWGSEPSRYRTLYAHLSQSVVSVGQSIKRGDKIGTAGATGTSAIHLHFNVHDATAGLKGYIRETDCSGNWPDGVIDPESVLRFEDEPPPDPNPTPTTVKFGLGYGTQNELTQQNADFYGSTFGTDANASFKFLTLPDSGAMTRSIQKIKAKNTSGLCARIFFSAGNTPFTPQNFVDYSSNGTIAAYGQGILDFEVHNEPNLSQEASGTWTNGAGFGNWLKNTIPLLRSRYPNARFWFPGLSPNDAAPQFMADALSVSGLSSLLHGYCFHSYWHTESGGQWNMNDETGGLSWKKIWRALPPAEQAKPIWISEFSNNNPSAAGNVKGGQYKRYRSLLSQNGVSIASSFVLFWSDDPNHENWVNQNNSSTGIKEGYLAP